MPSPSAPEHATNSRNRLAAPSQEPAPLVQTELLRTLWQVKTDAEAALPASGEPFSADWGDLLRSTGSELDVMSFQPRLAQLPLISRPCLLEVLPHASAEHAELWVLARGLPDGVLVYGESGALIPVPLSKLRRVWYGTLYLTSGRTSTRGRILNPACKGSAFRPSRRH